MDTIELRQKSDIHLSRKLFHAIGVTTMCVIYLETSKTACWFIVTGILAVILPFDLMRLRRPHWNNMAIRVLRPLMRKHESSTLSGTTYLFMGAFVLLFLDHRVVTLTLLFLAFGDPIASFFGIRYGKDKILGNKTLQGTAAGFVVCTLIAGVYYYFNNIMAERLLIVAPLSGLIGALAELIPIGKLDDNFTFPVIGGAMLWLLFQLFGGFGL